MFLINTVATVVAATLVPVKRRFCWFIQLKSPLIFKGFLFAYLGKNITLERFSFIHLIDINLLLNCNHSK